MLLKRTILSNRICSRAVHCRNASSIPAAFMRGGTSKAVFFKRSDLPANEEAQAKIFRNAIGSPDPNGRQLNGMGGGLSSVSKVLVVEKSLRDDADIEYTFVQVGVKDGLIDKGSNCGNMLAAVGPYAVDEGFVRSTGTSTTVRIYNTNTAKIVHSSFPTIHNKALYQGDFAIDGVAGSGARIDLEFHQPAGSRTGMYLPTGNTIDSLDSVEGYQGPSNVEVSLLDCGNPCVFVSADMLDGFDPEILPGNLEKDTKLLDQLEQIRRASLVKMGIVSSMDGGIKVRSIPKICIVSPYQPHTLLSGCASVDSDITVRCISSGDPHRAIPVTAALCLAAAAQTTGSVVHKVMTQTNREIVISHPSGSLMVGATVENGPDGVWSVPKASSMTTARRLFEGRVFVE